MLWQSRGVDCLPPQRGGGFRGLVFLLVPVRGAAPRDGADPPCTCRGAAHRPPRGGPAGRLRPGRTRHGGWRGACWSGTDAARICTAGGAGTDYQEVRNECYGRAMHGGGNRTDTSSFRMRRTATPCSRLLTDEGELVTVVGCIPCAAPGEEHDCRRACGSTTPATASSSPPRRWSAGCRRAEEELISLPRLRHHQGRRPGHGRAAGGAVRRRDAGCYRGGAGAAADRQGHHRASGPWRSPPPSGS